MLRIMIANSQRWAMARGLTRTNPVHGLEEYKIPTEEAYLFRNAEEQSAKVEGSFVAEARILGSHCVICRLFNFGSRSQALLSIEPFRTSWQWIL